MSPISDMTNDGVGVNIKKRITWGSVRNKNLKTIMISSFVLELQKKFNLSFIETKQIKDFIDKGIMLKYIDSKDIFLNSTGKKIKSINGVDVLSKIYQNKAKSFGEDPPTIKTYQYLYNYWRLYLTTLNKIVDL